jgi:hypothetical protein
VNDREVGAPRWSWNIGLIVCCRKSWNRSMRRWCPTNDGRSRRPRIRRQ